MMIIMKKMTIIRMTENEIRDRILDPDQEVAQNRIVSIRDQGGLDQEEVDHVHHAIDLEDEDVHAPVQDHIRDLVPSLIQNINLKNWFPQDAQSLYLLLQEDHVAEVEVGVDIVDRGQEDQVDRTQEIQKVTAKIVQKEVGLQKVQKKIFCNLKN